MSSLYERQPRCRKRITDPARKLHRELTTCTWKSNKDLAWANETVSFLNNGYLCGCGHPSFMWTRNRQAQHSFSWFLIYCVCVCVQERRQSCWASSPAHLNTRYVSLALWGYPFAGLTPGLQEYEFLTLTKKKILISYSKSKKKVSQNTAVKGKGKCIRIS